MEILEDLGDTLTIWCDCGTIYTSDATGENCHRVGDQLIPVCPGCGLEWRDEG